MRKHGIVFPTLTFFRAPAPLGAIGTSIGFCRFWDSQPLRPQSSHHGWLVPDLSSSYKTGRGRFRLGDTKMPDDKRNVGEPDRSRVSGDQDYEVRYLAEKYGLSEEQARELITRIGNGREKLEEAAKGLATPL